MLRRIGGWLGQALVDALLAGLGVGLLELARVATLSPARFTAGGFAGLTWIVLGLVALGAVVTGVAALAVTSGCARLAPVAGWLDEVRAGGGARAAALVRAALAVLAVAGLAAATFRLAAWTHESFHEPRPIALVEAFLVPVFALVLGVAALGMARRLAPRAARSERIVRWTGGARGVALVAGAAALAMIALPAVAAAAAPAADLGRPRAALHFAVLLACLRGTGIGRRRAARGAAAAVALLALSAPLGLRATPPARAAISGHGAASLQVLTFVWRALDRDGDGYPSAVVGGADCDDSDRAVSPAAGEIIGNGRDENCNGRDVTRDALAHRLTARPPPTGGARNNDLLITVDSLRADHLGAYGYERNTSPNIDRLAARSARFEWAFSTTPSTRWAIPALSTGRYASAAGLRANGDVKTTRAQTLAQTFAAAGYETKGVMCCTRFFGKPTGAFAGFASIDDSANAAYKSGRPEKYNSDEVATRVIRFLEQRKETERPFLLWTHLIDPHHPYFHLPGTPEYGSTGMDRYDSEISFVDRQIGRIVNALERTRLADDTIVVVTADHGDEFKEHGHYHHGKSLYNQAIRVPLIIRAPRAQPRVVDVPVSLVDVAPTLAELAGIPTPAGQNGHSLAGALMSDARTPRRPILAELFPDREIKRSRLAVIDGCDKLVWDRQANTYELFSLCDDPADAADRAAAEPDEVDRMRRVLTDSAEIELTPLPTK